MPNNTQTTMSDIVQVLERDAAEAARKAARQDAADRIYDKLRLEKEAALHAQVGGSRTEWFACSSHKWAPVGVTPNPRCG